MFKELGKSSVFDVAHSRQALHQWRVQHGAQRFEANAGVGGTPKAIALELFGQSFDGLDDLDALHDR
eukprot:11341646-Heterocapsa_arctica.AAC.1